MKGRSAEPEVKVLLISPSESDAVALRRFLSHTAWSLEVAGTLADALAKLEANAAPVIFCAQTVPDGTWQDALAMTSVLPYRPNVIVLSTQPDDKLWMEVLDSGAYDLLGKPLKADEVFRIISLAWLQWKQQLRQSRRQQARPVQTEAAPAACSSQIVSR
jgi:DNA-binding NtrC family response regulator